MLTKRLLLVLLNCGLLAVSSRADQYIVKGAFTQSAVPTAISVNDGFTLTFDYNTAVADVMPPVEFSVFLNAVSNLTFTLNPGAVGTYAAATMAVVPSILLTDNFIGVDSFTMRPAPGPTSTFSAADGKAFTSLWLQLDGHSVFTNVKSTGDVLADILPVLDQSKFDVGARFTLEFGTDRSAAVANVTSIARSASQQVPDTGSTIGFLTLALVGLCTLAGRRWK